MPFPHHDPAWAAVAARLQSEVRVDEIVVASDLFWIVLPVVNRYRDTWLNPDSAPDWLVVHKGEFEQIEPSVLGRALRERPVVMANDVFVVFGPVRLGEEGPSEETTPHVLALQLLVDGPTPRLEATSDPVLPDVAVIERFDRYGVPEVKAAMEAFFSAGGYEYSTLRDRVYDSELDRLLSELIGPGNGRRRLDLASGMGRAARALGEGAMVLTDVSEVAMRACRSGFPDAGGWVVMDAALSALRSGAFDDVIFCDAFEHVCDPGRTIAEAARLLRPGGRFFLTANNRNSLNQRITRALGHPEFVVNYQHITEIAFDDFALLLDAAGFDVIESRGLFLFPYWGVPGIDEHVRQVIDHDPEVVEVSRELGELVGAAHAFVSVVLAQKR